MAYSPLERTARSTIRELVEIETRLDLTTAQVMLRWAIQRGVVVIPKSSHRNKIVSNARIFDFVLGSEDMQALDALDRSSNGTEEGALTGGATKYVCARDDVEPRGGSMAGQFRRADARRRTERGEFEHPSGVI